jgi:hypothetical protein
MRTIPAAAEFSGKFFGDCAPGIKRKLAGDGLSAGSAFVATVVFVST